MKEPQVEGVAMHKKCKYTNQSANGAKYDSQGQARSASPQVKQQSNIAALKGRNTAATISAFQA